MEILAHLPMPLLLEYKTNQSSSHDHVIEEEWILAYLSNIHFNSNWHGQ